jgi:hypothetical protein
MTSNKNELNFLGFQQVEDSETYEAGEHDQRITIMKYAVDNRRPLKKKVRTNKETYSISCRAKRERVPIGTFLMAWLAQLNRIKDVSFDQIDSVFGFVDEPSPLYGGRAFTNAQISQQDIHFLYDHNIGLKLLLSNLQVNDDDYKQSMGLLKRFHYDGNILSIASDLLAKRIKSDFPKYFIESSVVKEPNSLDNIEDILSLYDGIVLPIILNDDLGLLESISEKERVVLFANTECSYNCPSKVCYPSVSRFNKDVTQKPTPKCSVPSWPRLFQFDHETKMFFDINMYIKMGFTRYKVLTSPEVK